MIRLTYLLRRQPGISRREFQQYWREQHGPLVARFANTLAILRYVQVHTILDDAQNEQHSGPRGAMEKPYDGAEEIWWAHHGDMVAGYQSPAGQAALQAIVEDEHTFIDHAQSPLWFNYEYPQVNPAPENLVATEFSTLIKSYFAIRHLPQLSMEEAQLYWRTEHGYLLRRIATAGHIKRYLQVHRFDDDMEGRMRQVRGTLVEPYSGHAELWFDRNDAHGCAPEISRGGELAVEDERKFIDFARSSMWYGKEHVCIDSR
jgi:hypothetical protein